MHRPPRPAYDRLAAPLRQVSQSLTMIHRDRNISVNIGIRRLLPVSLR